MEGQDVRVREVWVWRRIYRWVPVGVLVLAVGLDLLARQWVSTAPLLAVAPVVAAPVLEPLTIIAVGVAAMAAHAALAYSEGTFGPQSGIGTQLTLVAITALAVGLNRTLRSHHATADKARHAAQVAQQAVLPTPPERTGGLEVAARYVPADETALIGGDLYVVQETPYGVRAMIGDVRGKGLSAIAVVSADIGAFRYAADHCVDLPTVVETLEETLVREGERQGGLEQTEGFTTALLVEFTRDLEQIRLVNRGHPAPLLLDPAGHARLLEPGQEAPPLGITTLGSWVSPVETYELPPGGTLLCFTDGVTEARDRSGTFYDPADRISRMLDAYRRNTGYPADPQTVLDFLVTDVHRHSAGPAQDDQALLALTRPLRRTDLLVPAPPPSP
ncbi:serine/threonine-protein phosphatase [Streptomyces smyrnaeus]|uniref:Serine/threonine-protein phosphatase n=1 Tax=Streptomyces smyrnaeus TaxID=1387713 RepID=A0ABS3Y4V3_9ACTN|nr:serine/threonine-protein phosphatase [Streptomyces smyrnaeus]